MMFTMNGQTGSRRPTRLPRWLADEIEEHMLSNGFPTDERLPTETELATTYGVSRQVVREAARLLEDRGLVNIRPGRGMTVAAIDTDAIAQRYRSTLRRDRAGFEQLMELRQMTELDMTALAAEQRTEDDLARMREILDDISTRLDDYVACLDADLEFHMAVAAATQNPFVVAFVQPINTVLRELYREPIGYLATQEDTLREHRAIADAIATGDAAIARTAAAAHLGRVRSDATRLVGAENDAAEPATRS